MEGLESIAELLIKLVVVFIQFVDEVISYTGDEIEREIKRRIRD